MNLTPAKRPEFLAAIGLGLNGVFGLSCGPILFEGPGDANDDIKPKPLI